jgi:hypothetical protein
MLKYGSIVWLSDTLMYYRIHDENDSNIEDTVGGIALLNYIAKKGISKNQDFFVAMRYDLWRKWLVKQDKVNLFTWRNRVVFITAINSQLHISMPIFLAAPTPTFSVRETTFKVLANLSFHGDGYG